MGTNSQMWQDNPSWNGFGVITTEKMIRLIRVQTEKWKLLEIPFLGLLTLATPWNCNGFARNHTTSPAHFPALALACARCAPPSVIRKLLEIRADVNPKSSWGRI